MPDHRRALLKASAVAILVYAVVVVVYANMVPYLGVRYFVQQVQKVRRDPVPVGDLVGSPQIEDHLIEIAGQRVERGRSPLGTIVNTTANLNNEARFPAEVVRSVDDLMNVGSHVAEVNGQRFVRLRFRAPDGDPRGEFERWYRVDEPELEASLLSIVWLAIESVIFWLGWLVFRRRPEDDSAALFFLMCIVTVGAYMGWYHWLEIASSPALVFVFAVCAMAVPQISLHFHLVAPAPKRFMLRFPRLTLLLLYGIPGLVQLSILWAISRMFYTFRHQLPAEGAWWERFLGNCLWTYLAIGAAMFVGCVVSLWHSYWYPRQPGHRDQVRWLLWGSLIASIFIGYSFWLAVTDWASFLVGDATWAMFMASCSFAGAYAISILRYRLLRIEEIVEQRGWIYLTIRFLGAITFYGVVLVLIWLTPRVFTGVPQETGLLIPSFVILALYLLTSLRSWLGSILDRRFYRERSQLDWAMRRMNEAVGNLVDPPTVRHRSLVIAANCVQAKGAAIYQRSSRSGFQLAGAFGSLTFPEKFDADHPLLDQLKEGSLLQKSPGPLLREDVSSQLLRSSGAEVAQPLIHDDKLVGFLLFGPKREGFYGSAELAFLAGLADIATIALQCAQSQQTLERLNTDLRHRVARVSAPPSSRPLDERPSLPAPPLPPLHHVESLRGSGTAIGAILDTVRKVASSNATVLIRGESGTGKSMLAEIIHRNSPRAAGPFVKVHCAALSSSLLESELFGHVRGAYTGAIRDKIGRFQLADGGTLFLDEIGDISIDTQTKLLRVLQEMTFEPVGSSESIRVDVRLIAATHQPLEELIRKGRVREDLYYRLNVISVRMPSLRERREDIDDLASHFLALYSKQTNKDVREFDPEALDRLEQYDWPGNIRELQNVLEHAVVMCGGTTIMLEDLPGDLKNGRTARTLPRPALVANDREPFEDGAALMPLASELDDLERQRLLDALDSVGGNKSQAARLLGIPRSTLCSKLRKFGLS